MQIAEAKLGELLSNQVPLREPGGTFGNTLPSDINKKESHYAQENVKLLINNPPGFTKKNSGIINQNPLPVGINKHHP